MIKFHPAKRYISLLIPSTMDKRALIEMFRMNGFGCALFEFPQAQPDAELGSPGANPINGSLPTLMVNIADEELYEDQPGQPPVIVEQGRKN